MSPLRLALSTTIISVYIFIHCAYQLDKSWLLSLCSWGQQSWNNWILKVYQVSRIFSIHLQFTFICTALYCSKTILGKWITVSSVHINYTKPCFYPNVHGVNKAETIGFWKFSKFLRFILFTFKSLSCLLPSICCKSILGERKTVSIETFLMDGFTYKNSTKTMAYLFDEKTP